MLEHQHYCQQWCLHCHALWGYWPRKKPSPPRLYFTFSLTSSKHAFPLSFVLTDILTDPGWKSYRWATCLIWQRLYTLLLSWLAIWTKSTHCNNHFHLAIKTPNVMYSKQSAWKLFGNSARDNNVWFRPSLDSLDFQLLLGDMAHLTDPTSE